MLSVMLRFLSLQAPEDTVDRISVDKREGRMTIRGLLELRSIPLALGLLTGLLQACGEKPAPAVPEKALVRSDTIKKRLEEPILPLPGARFIRTDGGEPTG